MKLIMDSVMPDLNLLQSAMLRLRTMEMKLVLCGRQENRPLEAGEIQEFLASAGVIKKALASVMAGAE